MRYITFKGFLSETKTHQLPTIRTTGLSSEQEKGNTLPIIHTTGLSSDLKEQNEQPLHTQLVNHYKFNKEHENTINRITSGSKRVNDYLHRQHKGLKPKTEQKGEVSRIDKVLSQHKTPTSFHVYSGIHHAVKAGQTYHHPAYLHTSINKSEAESFAKPIEHTDKKTGQLAIHRHLLKLEVPKGHHGAYVDHISRSPGEREFILPRGHNIKIHHTTTTTEHMHVYHVHHATIEP